MTTDPAAPIDHHTVDWSRVRRVSYLLEQRFRYTYPGPITSLRQRLIVVPAVVHGGQRLLDHAVDVDSPMAEISEARDQFGNRVHWVDVPRVEQAITFRASILLDRIAGFDGPLVPLDLATTYLAATALTAPDTALRDAAALIASDAGGLAGEAPVAGGALTAAAVAPGQIALSRGGAAYRLTAHINAWVHRHVRYANGATTVDTPAADALTLRAGVCQDYAHVMLALCRLSGIPARYVSGHLLGEGGTHAWVEVLLPAMDQPGMLVARAYDPTHGRRAGVNYITVATGRDYRDVAPTSGWFTGPHAGTLSASKEAVIASLEYAEMPWG